jgi:O-antigen ligase
LSVDISPFVGLSLKNIIIYLAIITLIVKITIKKGKKSEKINLIPLIVLFLSYCFLSIIITSYIINLKNYSLIKEFIFFKNYIDPFLLLWISINTPTSNNNVKSLIFLNIITFLIFNIITMLGSFDIIQISRISLDIKYGRTTGALAEPNQYASFIVFYVLICINIYSYLRPIVAKYFVVLIILIGLYCLLLTGSRGGILALMTGITCLFFFNKNKITLKTLAQFLSSSFVFGTIIIILFFSLPGLSQEGLEKNLISRAMQQDLSDYSSGRIQVWSEGIKLFLKSPVIGSGFNTFTKKIGSNSHNDFLLHLATLGIFGFMLYIMIFLNIFSIVWRFKKKNTENIFFYNGYLSAMISFMTAMFFVNIYTPMLFFFLYSGLILKMGLLERQKEMSNPIQKIN